MTGVFLSEIIFFLGILGLYNGNWLTLDAIHSARK